MREYLSVKSTSQLNWSGGTVAGDLTVGVYEESTAVLRIFGSDFAIDGAPVELGRTIFSIFGGDYNNEPFRLLTGRLEDDNIINHQFRIGEAASIILVPEPATLLLLTLGTLTLRRRTK